MPDHKKIKKILLFSGAGLLAAAVAVSIIVPLVLLKKKTATSSSGSSTSSSSTPLNAVLSDRPPEVWLYNVGDSYNFPNMEQADTACQAHGSFLATPEQATNELNNGASWCAYGYMSNGEPAYPMQPEDSGACDNKSGIITNSQVTNAGALCFGVKPEAGTEGVYSFSTEKWSKYD